MPAKDHIAYVDEELATFKGSLTRYQKQTQAWYSQHADNISRHNDLPSLVGMERIIKVGDVQKSVSMTDSDFSSTVARCPLKGPLLIESKFESIYDIPIGDIDV